MCLEELLKEITSKQIELSCFESERIKPEWDYFKNNPPKLPKLSSTTPNAKQIEKYLKAKEQYRIDMEEWNKEKEKAFQQYKKDLEEYEKAIDVLQFIDKLCEYNTIDMKDRLLLNSFLYRYRNDKQLMLLLQILFTKLLTK